MYLYFNSAFTCDINCIKKKTSIVISSTSISSLQHQYVKHEGRVSVSFVLHPSRMALKNVKSITEVMHPIVILLTSAVR